MNIDLKYMYQVQVRPVDHDSNIGITNTSRVKYCCDNKSPRTNTDRTNRALIKHRYDWKVGAMHRYDW